MENRRNRRALNDLPEPIIHHIQSFLNGRQAAKTTVLSQIWHKSWKSRPTLDFDERDFQLADGFLQFVSKTIDRYEDSKLMIDKFNLRMKLLDSGSSYLAACLISKAMKMGVNDVNVEIKSPPGYMFVLPVSVFENTSLVTLSISRCTVDRTSGAEIMCHGLKGFRLSGVRIDDDMMVGITTSCPLMENVFLADCEGFSSVNVSELLHLEKVHIKMANTELDMSPLIKFHERTTASINGDPYVTPVFKRLSSLLLEGVQLDTDFFSLFSAMFPCLIDLSIRHCHGFERFLISSKSVRFMNFQSKRILKSATFDVPSIRMFKYSGVLIPSLSFTKCSKEWESNLMLSWSFSEIGASEFCALKEFLSSFVRSKISLVMDVTGKTHPDLMTDIQLLPKSIPKPAVENFELMVLPFHHRKECLDLWYGLLWSFSPKFIHYAQLCKSIYNHYQFWVAFAERLILHGTRTAEALSYIEGLEGVSLELLGETQSEWKPLLWKTFLDASMIPTSGRKVRFQLKWK